VLFHCKPVNQQKTSIFALILWEEQRLNCCWSEKRCWNSTFTFGHPKSVQVLVDRTLYGASDCSSPLFFLNINIFSCTQHFATFYVQCITVWHTYIYNKYNQTVVSIYTRSLICQKPSMDHRGLQLYFHITRYKCMY
jgi:hypothetical protein